MLPLVFKQENVTILTRCTSLEAVSFVGGWHVRRPLTPGEVTSSLYCSHLALFFTFSQVVRSCLVIVLQCADK